MKDLKQNYPTMFTAYKDVVNVNQLAEMLGIGITLAYRLVKQNTIKSIKLVDNIKFLNKILFLIY